MFVEYVRGDLLTLEVEAIAHVVNCLCVRPHGLSLTIAQRYPESDVYGRRRSQGGRNLAVYPDRGTPGTIVTYYSHHKYIVSLLAQWDYGTAHQRHKRHIPPYRDTREERTQWFRECLEALGDLEVNTIAFPYKMGCNLGGQPWPLYEELIGQFARQTGKRVLIVQKVG